MSKSKKEETKPLPRQGLPKMPSVFSGGRTLFGKGGAPKSFIPPTPRFTQHKGGGGK